MPGDPQSSCGTPAPAPQLPRWGWGLRRGLVEAFRALSWSRFQLTLRGLDRFTNSPSTIIICNHQSDYDLVLLAPIFYFASQGRPPIARTMFVAAEHMFCRGYVSNYLVPGPRGLKRLLYPANLSAALQAIGAFPLALSRARRLSLHLDEILEMEGDLPLDRIFRRPPRKIFPGVHDGATIRSVLRERWQQQLFSVRPFSAFVPEVAQKLRRAHLEQIHRQLQMFAAVLDRGGCLFLAPEGVLCDGGIKATQIKAGLGRLIRMTQRPVTLLPVNITYDRMTVGRPAAFVSIGAQVQSAHAWSVPQLQHAVAASIQSLGVVTLSRIVRELRRWPAADRARLRDRAFRRARELAGAGVTVDPQLLDAARFDRRWRKLLQYERRRRGVQGPFGWNSIHPPPIVSPGPAWIRREREDYPDRPERELGVLDPVQAPPPRPRMRHRPG